MSSRASTFDLEDDIPCSVRRRDFFDEDLDEEADVSPRPFWSLPWVWVVAGIVVMVGAMMTSGSSRDAAYSRMGAGLQMYRQHQGRQTLVEDGARVTAGDALHLAVDTARFPYLLVVSLDGAGNPDVYFPYGQMQSGTVKDGHVELPGSLALDKPQGPVRLFAFFSNGPISVRSLAPALEHVAKGGRSAVRDATNGLPVVGGIQRTLYFEKD